MSSDAQLPIALPDWKRWLTESAALAAADPSEYNLHLAAHEWGLSGGLDINDPDEMFEIGFEE